MIAVLTGTGPDTFERLIRPLDELAGRCGWDVFVQLGHTPFEPRWCKYERFVERSALMKIVADAELVITHGGFGSMRDALALGRSVVAVPRRVEFNEVQDDHQEELVGELERGGYVIGVRDVSDLESAIERARTFSPGTVPKSRIPDLINKFLARSR
ncbi:MAG: glycosyltransferase [Thiogranum sp.]